MQSLNGANQILSFGVLKIWYFISITLKFIRRTPRGYFNCYNCKEIRQVAQLHQRLSRLQEHKFNLNFQDSINLLCGFGMNIESNSHFFSLHCPLFHDKRITLLSTLNKLDSNSLFHLEKISFILMHSFYLLKDSKNPYFNVLQLRTKTKYFCISNHPFTLSEFFNLLHYFEFQ